MRIEGIKQGSQEITQPATVNQVITESPRDTIAYTLPVSHITCEYLLDEAIGSFLGSNTKPRYVNASRTFHLLIADENEQGCTILFVRSNDDNSPTFASLVFSTAEWGNPRIQQVTKEDHKEYHSYKVFAIEGEREYILKTKEMYGKPYWIFTKIRTPGDQLLRIQTRFYPFSHPLAKWYGYADPQCVWYHDFAKGLRNDLELPRNIIIDLSERQRPARISFIFSQDYRRRELEENTER